MEAKRIPPTPASFVNITGMGDSLTVSCSNGIGPLHICDWFQNGKGTLSTTSAPSTLGISLTGNSQFISINAATAAGGPYTATLTVTANSGCSSGCSQKISVSLTVTAGPKVTVVSTGNFSGCTTQYPNMSDNPNVCPPRGGMPQPPPPGSTFADAQLGWTIRGSSPACYVPLHDANVSDFNIDGSLLVLANLCDSGNPYLVNRQTGAPICSLAGHGGNAGQDLVTWSAIKSDPKAKYTYYGLNGNQVTKHVITLTRGGSSCSVNDNPRGSGFPVTVHGTNILTAGTVQINRLGYYAAIGCSGKSACDGAGQSPIIALINLNKATVEATYNFSSDLRTYLKGVTYPRLSKGVSSTTGKMYMWIDGYGPPNGQVMTTEYSTTPGSGTITADGPLPTYWKAPAAGHYNLIPSSQTECAGNLQICQMGAAPHGDTVEAGGHEFYVTTADNGRYLFPVSMSPDIAGISKMSVPIEFGGGAMWGAPLNYNETDFHLGCAVFAPICILSTELACCEGGVATAKINSASSSHGNIIVTFASPPPFATGQSASFGGVGPECTNLFGEIAGSQITVSGTTATIAGITCSKGSASTGFAIRNSAPPYAENDAQIMALDYTNVMNNAFTIRKGAHSFAVPISDNFGWYYYQPHASSCMDGTCANWGSNFGGVNVLRTYTADTGYIPPPDGSSLNKQ
jgi:hypothetical protein